MPLRTLIVDDEPIARKVLREELGSFDDVEIIGEADNGAVALEKISADHPDLVLLDLQMPVMGGLEVVRNLIHGTHMPVIVMVTAYDNTPCRHSRRAPSITYSSPWPASVWRRPSSGPSGLLEGRLRSGWRSFRRSLSQPAIPQARRIVGRIGEEYFLLSADEIYAFQAEGTSSGSSLQRRNTLPPRRSRSWTSASETPAFEEFIETPW